MYSLNKILMDYTVRDLTVEDEPIVWQFLQYAAHESSVESVRNNPALTIYAKNWGRQLGDRGCVAQQDDLAIGMAWVRLWSGEERGYGYINQRIPELAIAVLPDYCGQGIGTYLLKNILAMAKESFSAVSLSVRGDNAAVRLYERVGFIKIPGSDILNRTGEISFNMIYQFE